jgi:hypothetical protein
VNRLRRFVPSRYSLRHGNYTASSSLCSWVFEGTTNLLDWVVLRDHSNDSSLANPFVWASWTILHEKQVCTSTNIFALDIAVTQRFLLPQAPDANRAATTHGQHLAAHKSKARLASGKMAAPGEEPVFPCLPGSIPYPSSSVFDIRAKDDVRARLGCIQFMPAASHGVRQLGWRAFRIRMRDKNSSNTNTLVLAGTQLHYEFPSK